VSYGTKQLNVLGLESNRIQTRGRSQWVRRTIRFLEKNIDLAIHAQLNTKCCQMRAVEFDTYKICTRGKETLFGGITTASTDQDNGNTAH
jgi:hypothetical protein